MVLVKGADASSLVTPDEMRSLGLAFVARYFSQFTSKNLTSAEAKALGDAGFNLVSVYEDDVNDWAGGSEKGAENATRARGQGNQVGMPTARPFYFAVDQNVDAQNPTLHSYFSGANSVLGAAWTGVYGSTAVCEVLKSLGLVNFTWRTMSTAWEGGSGDGYGFTLEQTGYINSKFDADTAIAADYGQWRIGWTPNTNVPTVHLSIVDMCAKEDPRLPASKTTNWANVYPVQKALIQEGFLKPQYLTGHYGPETVSAYAGWQGKCGYRGSNADGIPGMLTLTKLGELHNFMVAA